MNPIREGDQLVIEDKEGNEIYRGQYQWPVGPDAAEVILNEASISTPTREALRLLTGVDTPDQRD